MMSHDMLAQHWIGMGHEMSHISYYKRVDLDDLMRLASEAQDDVARTAGRDEMEWDD